MANVILFDYSLPTTYLVAVRVNDSYGTPDGKFYTVRATMIGLTVDTNKPVLHRMTTDLELSEYADYFENPCICVLC